MPVTVKVKPDPPSVWLVGEMRVKVGAGLSIVNVSALEAPPPGPGFEVVTLTVPGVAMSAGVMLAASWLALAKVVLRAVPFHSILAPRTKLPP